MELGQPNGQRIELLDVEPSGRQKLAQQSPFRKAPHSHHVVDRLFDAFADPGRVCRAAHRLDAKIQGRG